MRDRLIRIGLLAALALPVALGVAWWTSAPPAPGESGGTVGTASVGGPFELVDHTGRTVTDATFRGRWMLVSFGYSFCPDVCPTELAKMAQAVDRLGPAGERVAPIFVTIDPERDTPEHLAEYVPLFHPRLVGLTGTPEQVATAARAYRVYYAKAEADAGGDYLMDHSAYMYLMDPDGRFVTVYGPDVTADAIAEDVGRRIEG